MGASISFFVTKLIAAAEEHGIDLEIETVTVDQARTRSLEGYDLILVAPQVRFHADALRERSKGKPVVPIDGFVYATLNGEQGLEKLILPYIQGEERS